MFYQGENDHSWLALTGIFTALLALIAYYQLRSLAKTSKADFIHKFKHDFFTSDTRKLFMKVDLGQIKFIENGKPPYFKDTTNQEHITTYEIDDLLLGHLEDLGTFEKNGVIDIDMLYELFDYYISKSWKNEEIKNYMEYSGDKEIYCNFTYIYKKCKSFGEAKRRNDNLFLWRMTWKLKNFCL